MKSSIMQTRKEIATKQLEIVLLQKKLEDQLERLAQIRALQRQLNELTQQSVSEGLLCAEEVNNELDKTKRAVEDSASTDDQELDPTITELPNIDDSLDELNKALGDGDITKEEAKAELMHLVENILKPKTKVLVGMENKSTSKLTVDDNLQESFPKLLLDSSTNLILESSRNIN